MKYRLSLLILATLAALSSVPAMAATTGNYSDALEIVAQPAGEIPKLAAAAGQSGSGHSVTLTFTASTSAGSCTASCSFGYNVFRGTAAGAESTTPLNSSPITTTTFTDSTITLGSSPVTYFYIVEAVETASGVTVASSPSNEASATFPGIPTAPTTVVATPK
jgi:hypothetical protein